MRRIWRRPSLGSTSQVQIASLEEVPNLQHFRRHYYGADLLATETRDSKTSPRRRNFEVAVLSK